MTKIEVSVEASGPEISPTTQSASNQHRVEKRTGTAVAIVEGKAQRREHGYAKEENYNGHQVDNKANIH
jgi:hypothetical protein